jgi:hypothetical protein
VYVDDLNIIGNEPDINEARHRLKTEFKMKDLGQTKFFLGLQLEHFHSSIFIYQAAYVQKVWRNSIWTSYIQQKLRW